MKRTVPMFLLMILVVSCWAGSAMAEDEPVSEELRNLLKVPLDKRVKELLDIENPEGFKYRQGVYSEIFRKVDDETYKVTFTERTATRTKLTVDRYILTLKQEGPREWVIADTELRESFDELRRSVAETKFRRFDRFHYDEEGFKADSGPGYLYLRLYEGGVAGYTIVAENVNYSYEVPADVPIGYYSRVLDISKKRYKRLMDMDIDRIAVSCDPVTCEESLSTYFEGLDDVSVPDVSDGAWTTKMASSEGSPRLRELFNDDARQTNKALKDNPFLGFRRAPEPDRRYWVMWLLKNDENGIGIRVDNYSAEEVSINAGLSGELGGTLFSYYSKETRDKGIDPYTLEKRPDYLSRDFEVFSLSGKVDLALEDPEVIVGDITYGLNAKRDLDVIPYFIATIPGGEGEERTNPSLKVNRVTKDGEELMTIPTGPYSGLIVLPETVKAGEPVIIEMEFRNRGIRKVNHAFSQMSRGGWLPFVQFTDKIHEFELTVRAPSEYKTLGVGHMVETSTEDGVTTTKWETDNPVTFPTVIFGKYLEGKPRFEATKKDGTVIPITVHVDEVSMGTLEIDIASVNDLVDTREAFNSGARGIRGKQLIPIAEQAANAVNLYREISGLDYPFDELNLVNDPAPAMYGQAPASLIYLGSLVFRGEGSMAGDTMFGGGGTSSAKFLKSVVAHEVGHQWWGGIINNANGRNYWFVESMAEFFSALWLEAVYDEDEYLEQVREWRRRILDVEQLASVQRSTTDYGGEFPGAAYQASVYNKGPYAFHILRRTVGDEKFFPALKVFCQDLAKKGEVTTLDIQRSLEDSLGGVDAEGNPYKMDLGWFFDQWIRGVGIPEYGLNYTTRQAEDGDWIVEGVVKQNLMIGNNANKEVMPDEYYRGFVWVTVLGKKKQEFRSRLVIQGAETPFKLKVPVRPLEVSLNKKDEILAHDVLVNR